MSAEHRPAEHRPGEIWLGDLLRAVRVLEITDPETMASMADLLGLTAVRTVEAPTTSGTPTVATGMATESVEAVATGAPSEQAAVESSAAIAEHDHADEGERRPGSLAIPARTQVPGAVQRTSTEANWDDVQRVPDAQDPNRAARPRHVSLLPPRSERAILLTMLSRSFPDGQVDIPALVDGIARGLPIRELPRRRVPTSRFGVQVLVDVGPAMELFKADQTALVEQVRGVIGKHATEVRYFAMNPLRGHWDEHGTRRESYHPPAPGCRVLLLSDLGLGGARVDLEKSSRSEWVKFTTVLRWHGCVPIGLVPFPPSRWPSWLSALLPLTCWDRSTTVSRARARLTWA